MSDATDNGWTVITLKEHLEALLRESDKRYDQRFAAQESATQYAQEKSNEFRGSLEDVGKNQMPRTEAEAAYRSISEKVDALQARIDRTEGRGGGLQAGWGYLVGAMGLIATIVMLFVTLRR